MREHPADGFLGETKIVGNVDPAHGQIEGPLGNAAGTLSAFEQRDEEARQPFGGGLASEQHHLPLRLRQFVCGETVELTFDQRMFADEPIEGLARKPPQFRLFERLNRERIFLVDADPQEIARKHEACNLSAAIGQQGIEFERTMRDHEHALRRIALVKYRLLGAEPLHRAKRPHAGEGRRVKTAANRDRTHRAIRTGMPVRKCRELTRWDVGQFAFLLDRAGQDHQ